MKMREIAFLPCSAIGYVLGHYLGQGAAGVLLSILISYHLYLGYLVFSAEREPGLSLPIVRTLLIHATFLALVILLGVGRNIIPFFWVVRLFIPAVAPFEADWLFSGGDADWFLNGGKKKVVLPALEFAVPETPWIPALAQELPAATPTAVAVSPASKPALAVAAPAAPLAAKPAVAAASAPSVSGAAFGTTTAEEYEEFLAHLRGGKRPFRKPGMSVKQEFELWYSDRARNRPAQQETAQSA